jgi:ribosomal protein S18 acetylase RimI-like enzyme
VTRSPVAIRAATPADAADLAVAHACSWRSAYRGVLSDEFLDALGPDRWRAAWAESLTATDWPRRGTLLACADDEVVGFVSVGPTRDDDAGTVPTGEVTGIYVVPAWWGAGVGTALMAAAQAMLTDAGCREATLWVLRDNVRARRFYERTGWLPDGFHKDAVVGGLPVTEVRYRMSLAPAGTQGAAGDRSRIVPDRRDG